MASFTTLPGQNTPPGFTNVSASSLAGLAGVIPSDFDGVGSGTKHQLALVQVCLAVSSFVSAWLMLLCEAWNASEYVRTCRRHHLQVRFRRLYTTVR